MQEAEKLKYQKQLKDALVAIQKLKAKVKQEKDKKHEPIAIIGMGMRLPGGVRSAEDYWNLLSSGTDAIRDIPESRFDAPSLYTEDYDTPGKMIVRQGGFLDDIDQFDGSFFDISYAEIESMDPQQRLLLEVTHEAFENAGITWQSLANSKTGVFIGVTNNDYQKRHFRSGDYTLINPYSYTGIAQSSHSGRLSYLLGLQGPSVSLDTACSSSLVATHLAVQSLRNGESDLAIAGAANLIIDPEFTIYFSSLNALSKDSRCKSFSNEANGFIRSEGSGVLILKRLSDAQRDGDNILAVVKGSAVNQDGRSNGFTAPNVTAQESLIKEALKNAQLQPEDVAFIEAHGTGTKIGDPIEMEAIAQVFASHKTKEEPLLVGSAKTNIGHTESAAGVAGMMKAVLALQNNTIPKNLHFETPNELIDWDSLPVTVPVENTDFDSEKKYVGISGFGVTGTNAHVIIGTAPKVEEVEKVELRTDVFVLPLSARTEEALQAMAISYAQFVETTHASLEDICAMAALKRTPFEYKKVFVALSKEEMVESLRDFAELQPEDEKTFDAEDVVKIVFVCPGQGAQWVGMAQQLYQSEKVFQQAIDEFSQAFSSYVSWNLVDELQGDNFEQIDIVQPVLVAIEVALGKMWQAKGIEPDMVVGHSMGEVAAAYLAGIISIDEAANIICTRSKLMKQTSGQGAMAVTDLTLEEAQARIAGVSEYLSVAVQNSSQSTVISGSPDHLNNLLSELESEGRFCRLIQVDVASHSPQMDALIPELREALKNINPQNSSIEFYSTAINQIAPGSELNADYWTQNLRNPVQFSQVVKSIADKNKAIFIELSPHPVLTSATLENIEQSKQLAKAIPTLWREKDEQQSFYKALGAFWETGLVLDWKVVYPNIGKFVILPNYPWQRERFWYEEQPQIAMSTPIQEVEVKQEEQIASTDKNLFYEIQWREVELETASLPSSVTLVMDSEGLGEEVASILESQGVQVEKITSTDRPSVISEAIIHLSCTNPKATQQDAIFSYRDLIQHFSDKGASPCLYAISKNGQITSDQDKRIHAPSTALWGMMRSVRNEFPELKSVTIDINSFTTAQDVIQVIGQSEQYGELAYRNQKWFTPVLTPVKVENQEVHPLSSSATYLVTGGTSGVGLVFAEWLASRGVQNLALVSRSGMKQETEPVVEKLKAQGVQVEVFKSDVSNLDEISKLVMEVESVLPTIQGVVHAAGVLDDAPFLNLTAEQFNKVLGPKLSGGWNLHKYFAGRKLESFILFSSGASILGTAAQANYSAANMSLDQLANYRKAIGQAALAINFGNIGGIGLAAADEVRGGRLKEQGMGLLMPEDLPAYFDALFDLPGSQYALMDIDFHRWSELNSNIKGNYLFHEVLATQEEMATETVEEDSPKSFANAHAAQRHFKDLIKQQLSSITKVPVSRIKEDATFKSIGVDSLMAVQLKNKLQAETEISLTVATIWTYPTVEKFAEYLSEQIDYASSQEEVSADEKAQFTNRASAVKHFKSVVKNLLSTITRIPTSKLKEDATFKSMGVDSLMAVQLKNKLQEELELTIAVSSIWAHPTIEKYAEFIADEMNLTSDEEATITFDTPVDEMDTSDSPTTSTSSIEDEVDQMSLDDLLDALDD